jgi:hypothetical protein
MSPFTDGFHTLSSAGPFTLIDVKQLDTSLSLNSLRIAGIIRRRWQTLKP